jgi:hypothetical protein
VQPPNRSLRERCYGASMPWDPFREAEGGATWAAAAAVEEEATVEEEAVQAARRVREAPAPFPDDGPAALESPGATAGTGVWTQTAQQKEVQEEEGAMEGEATGRWQWRGPWTPFAQEDEVQEQEVQEAENSGTAGEATDRAAQMDAETTSQTERAEIEHLQVRSLPFGPVAGRECGCVLMQGHMSRLSVSPISLHKANLSRHPSEACTRRCIRVPQGLLHASLGGARRRSLHSAPPKNPTPYKMLDGNELTTHKWFNKDIYAVCKRAKAARPQTELTPGERALAACLAATNEGGGVQSCVGLGSSPQEIMHAAASLPGVRALGRNPPCFTVNSANKACSVWKGNRETEFQARRSGRGDQIVGSFRKCV